MAERSPASSTLSLEALDRDPYPIFAELREREPIVWADDLRMWLVLSYEHVQTILRDSTSFVVGTDRSLILDTFGEHMLTTEGPLQEHHRKPFRGFFAPARIRVSMMQSVARIAKELVATFSHEGEVELRHAFAARLPVLSMLAMFGLPAAAEPKLRLWYDSFEAALSNFSWSEDVRARARADVEAFHALIQSEIESRRRTPREDLLSAVVNDGSEERLEDEEIRRNAAIIFFGGISTVEALIMDAVYALCLHPQILAQVRADRAMLPAVVDETMRWLAPVQSATRHVVQPVTVGDVRFSPGDTVNCMLSAANRDPKVFEDPELFLPGRPNVRRHLGFAAGPHFCLGSHLAKIQAELSLGALLDACPNFEAADPSAIEMRGHEFRQPKALVLRYDAGSRSS